MVLKAAVGLILLAAVLGSLFFILRTQGPGEVPERPREDARIDDLRAAAERNAAEIERLKEMVRELSARLEERKAMAVEAPKAEAVTAPGGTASPPALPPSPQPFLDYGTLPKEFLPYVGENEVFMLLEDGRLARLSLFGAEFSLEKDLETRETAQALLRLKVESRERSDSFVNAALAGGRYLPFPTIDEANQYLKEHGRQKLGLEKLPGEAGYGLIDLVPLVESEKASREEVTALLGQMKASGVHVFFVDPIPAGTSQEGGAKKLHQRAAR